ncbi:MAG: ATP synthase F1 subunit delta [Bacilli bacterium]|nr:ATP synthase F1 subunit delta [Bacilli bacterium]MBN2876655.1 ATP synthase F1 subunit delta [Bacilli bacterium]
MTGIANQYALAVFSLAEEAKRHEEFKKVLSAFVQSVDEETHKFFAHPKIERTTKMELVEKSVEDVLLANFLKVLIENDRFSLLEAIDMEYQEILDNLNKVMQVKVLSNQPLTKANIAKIEIKLKNTYHRSIEFEFVVDKSILGGVRIEFEGNVIDETINKQLDSIKSSLLE